jgi:hypothetical protein
VLICPAAGREDISLRRILFNFDLPWNPMDLGSALGAFIATGSVTPRRSITLADTIEVPSSCCSMKS